MLTVREINNIKMGAKKTPTTLPTASKQLTNSTLTNAIKTTAKKLTVKSKDNVAAAVTMIASSKSGSINAKDATKKSDNTNKVTATATSNKKASNKPVAISNEKIVAAKKPQIGGDLKKNKSRDNSIDNSNKKQGVNSKSKNTDVAEPAKSTSNSNATAVVGEKKKDEVNLNHEKCNKNEKSSPTKSNLEKSMKKSTEKESDKIKPIASEKHSTNLSNPKKVNSSIINKRSADKPKSSKTINVIKKTNKGRESKIKISNELKNLAIDGVQKEISSGLKTSICEMVKLKKARHNPNPNDKSNVNSKNNKVKEPQDKSLIKKVIESSNLSDEFKSDTQSSDQSIVNGTNAKEIKKITTASKTNNELVEKKKYVKKNDTKESEKKSPQETPLAEEPKIDIKNKSESISTPPPSTTTKKLKIQVEEKIVGVKANNKIISATNQKEKQKKENACNQSSAKPKGSNEETKVSNAKSNEAKIVVNNKTKVTAKAKSKLEQALGIKIPVSLTKKSSATVTKASKSKVMEKDPLKISSSEDENSSESENEKNSSVFKKPTKPRVKQAMKIVSRITSIKKCRVASLNAIAKVHCLYENEARVQHFDHSSSSFTKVVKKPTVVSVCNVSSDDDEDDDDDENKECVSKR